MQLWTLRVFTLMSSIRLTPIQNRLPGDLAMWFFILAELSVFALFFIGFAVTEQLNKDMFSQGKGLLHPLAGFVNTIALITSSLFVALAVNAVHDGRQFKSQNYLLLANVFGLVYLIVKGWEYRSLFNIGIDIETNTFFTLYFLITLFHFMHVILGMVILTVMLIKLSNGHYRHNVSGFESGACYWHMVDMLWIILFPLIYII